MVAGFGAYGVTSHHSKYTCRYKYLLGNTPSDEIEVEIINQDVDDKLKTYPVMFDEMIEVPAGTGFTVCVRMYGAT